MPQTLEIDRDTEATAPVGTGKVGPQHERLEFSLSGQPRVDAGQGASLERLRTQEAEEQERRAKEQVERRAKAAEEVRTRQEAFSTQERERLQAEAGRANQRKTETRSLFEDPKNVDKAWPFMQAVALSLKDPDEMRMRYASMRRMAEYYGAPEEEVNRNLHLYQRDYAKRSWGEEKPMDMRSFYTRLGTDMAEEKSRESVWQQAYASGQNAALAGRGATIAGFPSLACGGSRQTRLHTAGSGLLP